MRLEENIAVNCEYIKAGLRILCTRTLQHTGFFSVVWKMQWLTRTHECSIEAMCYMLCAMFYVLCAMCYVLFAMCYVLCAMCCVLYAICYMLCDMCYVLCAMCYVQCGAMCNVPCAKCHLPYATVLLLYNCVTTWKQAYKKACVVSSRDF